MTDPRALDPREQGLAEFRRRRFGLFLHWGLYTLAARHEWVKNTERLTDDEYRVYFEHFDPDLHDPGRWADEAKNAGMRYMVVTTKHHEGFALWDSATTSTGSRPTCWSGCSLTPSPRTATCCSTSGPTAAASWTSGPSRRCAASAGGCACTNGRSSARGPVP